MANLFDLGAGLKKAYNQRHGREARYARDLQAMSDAYAVAPDDVAFEDWAVSEQGLGYLHNVARHDRSFRNGQYDFAKVIPTDKGVSYGVSNGSTNVKPVTVNRSSDPNDPVYVMPKGEILSWLAGISGYYGQEAAPVLEHVLKQFEFTPAQRAAVTTAVPGRMDPSTNGGVGDPDTTPPTEPREDFTLPGTPEGKALVDSYGGETGETNLLGDAVKMAAGVMAPAAHYINLGVNSLPKKLHEDNVTFFKSYASGAADYQDFKKTVGLYLDDMELSQSWTPQQRAHHEREAMQAWKDVRGETNLLGDAVKMAAGVMAPAAHYINLGANSVREKLTDSPGEDAHTSVFADYQDYKEKVGLYLDDMEQSQSWTPQQRAQHELEAMQAWEAVRGETGETSLLGDAAKMAAGVMAPALHYTNRGANFVRKKRHEDNVALFKSYARGVAELARRTQGVDRPQPTPDKAAYMRRAATRAEQTATSQEDHDRIIREAEVAWQRTNPSNKNTGVTAAQATQPETQQAMTSHVVTETPASSATNVRDAVKTLLVPGAGEVFKPGPRLIKQALYLKQKGYLTEADVMRYMETGHLSQDSLNAALDMERLSYDWADLLFRKSKHKQDAAAAAKADTSQLYKEWYDNQTKNRRMQVRGIISTARGSMKDGAKLEDGLVDSIVGIGNLVLAKVGAAADMNTVPDFIALDIIQQLAPYVRAQHEHGTFSVKASAYSDDVLNRIAHNMGSGQVNFVQGWARFQQEVLRDPSKQELAAQFYEAAKDPSKQAMLRQIISNHVQQNPVP